MSDQDRFQSENQRSQEPPALPAVPPTHAGPLSRPALGYAGASRSVWPTVVGVIGLVFGIGGFLGSAGGAVIPLLMKKLLKNAPSMSPSMPPYSEDAVRWGLMAGLIGCVLAALLIVAGAGILKRLAWGPQTARIWAALKIVMGAVNTYVGFQMQTATMEAMKQTGPPGGMPGFLKAFTMAGALIGLLWLWALPIFMLIWFARSSIKKEVAGWARPDRLPADVV